MHSGLFIVEATDNMHDIDYDPSATTAKTLFMVQEFLMQHSSYEFEGNNKVVLIINQYTSGSQYTIVCY